MTRIIIILTVFMMTTKVIAQTVDTEKISLKETRTEEAILKKIVEETFVNGALNKLNTNAMRKGFHHDFAILIAQENNLNRLFLNDWINVVEEYKNSETQVNSDVRNLDYRIEILDSTEKTAVVKTEFFRNGLPVITDYLSYIKFSNGWKLSAKFLSI